MRALLSTLFWAFLALSSLALFPLAVAIWALTLPFDPRLRALHLFTCFWASLYTWANPAWPVEIEGRARIRRGEAYVMVANHQSLLDILVLFRLFVHFKWVSKLENFRIPLIGWNMHLNRYIPLRRGDRSSVMQMLARCRETLAAGSSVMIFPEGTRSPDGRLRAFKPGAFVLAQNAGRPILPIVVDGTSSALPKRGFLLQGRHRIRVRILEEIPAASFAAGSAEELALRVQALIGAELKEGQPAAR